MVYEEIRQGCKEYHQRDQYAYDDTLARYIAGKDQTKWDNPKTLDYTEAQRLIDFVNGWKTRMPNNSGNVTRLLNNLQSAVPLLNRLQNKTLLDVNFDEITDDGKSVGQVIEECFNRIAHTQRYEVVGASKMLNAAINPNLFVMWDTEIQSGYNLIGTGRDYAHEFLPTMQEIANQAVCEVMAEEGLLRAAAIQSFTDHCEKNNSLAKIIDEYNYTKYTAKINLAAKSNV